MYSIAAIVAASLLSFFAGFTGGWKVQDWRFTSKIATIEAGHSQRLAELSEKAREQEAKNRQLETKMREVADAAREKNREKARIIDRSLSASLSQLRLRSERDATPGSQVPGATPACSGVSGAELARGDGEFLARYAADAAKVMAAVKQCEAQYNAKTVSED